MLLVPPWPRTIASQCPPVQAMSLIQAPGGHHSLWDFLSKLHKIPSIRQVLLLQWLLHFSFLSSHAWLPGPRCYGEIPHCVYSSHTSKQGARTFSPFKHERLPVLESGATKNPPQESSKLSSICNHTHVGWEKELRILSKYLPLLQLQLLFLTTESRDHQLWSEQPTLSADMDNVQQFKNVVSTMHQLYSCFCLIQLV